MQLSLTGDDKLILDLKNIPQNLEVNFWKDVRKDGLKNLKKTASKHNKTGRLNRNVYSKQIDDGIEMGVLDNGMLVSHNGKRVNYGIFVEKGTKPHIIRPKKKKSLRFVASGGAFVFAKSINHPGYKGSHFLENAAKKTFSNLERIFNSSKEI